MSPLDFRLTGTIIHLGWLSTFYVIIAGGRERKGYFPFLKSVWENSTCAARSYIMSIVHMTIKIFMRHEISLSDYGRLHNHAIASTMQSSTDMTTLPPELLRPIAYHIYNEQDRGSLYALSLTSKVLCSEGERLLYRNITLSTEALHNKFLTTIVSSRQKALLVHAYSQDGPDYAGKRRLWNLLVQSFKLMHNLTHLSFRPSFLGEPDQVGKWGFQLLSLDCRGGHDVGQVLSDFLCTQPQLRRLGVDWANSSPAPITSSVCPALELLRGNRGAIEIFLPGRHVTSLAWTPHPTDPSTPVDQLAPSLNHLRALSFGGSISRPSLNSFVSHLQSLEVLKLVDPNPEVGPPATSVEPLLNKKI